MSWSVSYAIFAIAVMFALDNVTAQTPLTCHSCLKSTTSWNSTNTCPESFQETGAPNCRGKVCLMILADYEGDGSVLSVSCPSPELDHLLTKLQAVASLRLSNCHRWNEFSAGRKYYIYDGMCCTTHKLFTTNPANETICACDFDYCNRNLTSFPLNPAPTTTSRIIQTTAPRQRSFKKQGTPSKTIIIAIVCVIVAIIIIVVVVIVILKRKKSRMNANLNLAMLSDESHGVNNDNVYAEIATCDEADDKTYEELDQSGAEDFDKHKYAGLVTEKEDPNYLVLH